MASVDCYDVGRCTMKRVKNQFDELRLFGLFGLLVVAIMFFTIFLGNF
jgi:hypothetical protein